MIKSMDGWRSDGSEVEYPSYAWYAHKPFENNICNQ